jgi:predicted  nucleic acid-binding Zn-ribbon protein
MFKKLEERLRHRYKKTQIKLLEMKTTVANMKNALVKINGRLDTLEEKISEFDAITVETIQGEAQRK